MNVRVGYFLSIVLALPTLMGRGQTQLVQSADTPGCRDARPSPATPRWWSPSHGIEASRGAPNRHAVRTPVRRSGSVGMSTWRLFRFSPCQTIGEGFYPATIMTHNVGVARRFSISAKTGSQDPMPRMRGQRRRRIPRLMLARDLAFATGTRLLCHLFLRRSVRCAG